MAPPGCRARRAYLRAQPATLAVKRMRAVFRSRHSQNAATVPRAAALVAARLLPPPHQALKSRCCASSRPRTRAEARRTARVPALARKSGRARQRVRLRCGRRWCAGRAAASVRRVLTLTWLGTAAIQRATDSAQPAGRSARSQPCQPCKLPNGRMPEPSPCLNPKPSARLLVSTLPIGRAPFSPVALAAFPIRPHTIHPCRVAPFLFSPERRFSHDVRHPTVCFRSICPSLPPRLSTTSSLHFPLPASSIHTLRAPFISPDFSSSRPSAPFVAEHQSLVIPQSPFSEWRPRSLNGLPAGAETCIVKSPQRQVLPPPAVAHTYIHTYQ